MLAETSKYPCISFVYHNMSQTANRNHSFELIYRILSPTTSSYFLCYTPACKHTFTRIVCKLKLIALEFNFIDVLSVNLMMAYLGSKP